VFSGQAVGRLGRPSESREGVGVVLWPLHLVELVIRHPGFRVRFCNGHRTVGATPGAAKSFLSDSQRFGSPPGTGEHSACIRRSARTAAHRSGAMRRSCRGRQGKGQPCREARAHWRSVANQLFACSAGASPHRPNRGRVCQIEQTWSQDSESLAPQLAEARRAVVS
jgi:hypothetical protein